MTAFWLNSDSERLAAAHLADARPAWIWSADSEKLIWHNRAATAYEASHRRDPDTRLVPVARQIPRAIRLGVPLRSSRARLQFTLGRKPVSETCTCTPLTLDGGLMALLVVMADAVPAADLQAVPVDNDNIQPFAGEAVHFVLTGADGAVLASGGDGSERLEAGQSPLSELPAGDDGSRLVIFSDALPEPADETTPAPPDTEVDNTPPEESEDEADNAAPHADEQPAEADTAQAQDDSESAEIADVETTEAHADGDKLSVLLDQLDSRQVLYQPLSDSDDDFLFARSQETSHPEIEESGPYLAVAQMAGEPSEPALPIAAAGEVADASDADKIDAAPEDVVFEGEAPAPADTQADDDTEVVGREARDPIPVRLWKVIGRGFSPRGNRSEPSQDTDTDSVETALTDTSDASEDTAPFAEQAETVMARGDDADTSDAPTQDTAPDDDDAPISEADEAASDDDIERETRYNFDELSRILIDRVSSDSDTEEVPDEPSTAAPVSSLVNLGDEHLILNRLPIGLLVFRDQEILFSNRALSDLLGYVDGSSLRQAGLAGVFPSDGEQASAGPVTKLVGADGRAVNVSARLQTVIWQGRTALLLSASRQKEPLNAEDLARSFAELMGNALECGYFETSRAGMLTSVSGRAATLAGRTPDAMIGRSLHSLIAVNQAARLRGFLERPARSAGVERPMIRLAGADADTEVIVFAEGMAGIVTGYFGLLRRTEQPAGTDGKDDRIDPHFLIRLGRAVRQPVNAIIGFAELMRSQTFGPMGNERYADYVKFIHSAGQDIASVVDELENYARLNDSSYPVDTARIDLVDLLEECMARVRPFAGSVRVLVRSGISSSLPGISADRQTLSQALLNILASAIAHSPSGGQVVLSAQRRSDGAVEVHVRDGGSMDASEMDERFVVFRDGQSEDGTALTPIPSTIGLALTQSLLTVNGCSLDVSPGPGQGALATLVIPADIVESADSARR